MSHSPETVPTGAGLDALEPEYVQSVVNLNKMLDRGISWSGHEANCCFLNTGGSKFANVSGVTGLDFLDDGRGLALVDWDHDGDLDVWTSNRTAPMLRFVRNELPPEHHFLALRLIGTECNRDAINARVEVQLADDSQTTILRTLRAGEGFLGQSSKWLHMGLGDNAAVKRCVVHWPGGESEAISGVEADGHYRIRQGTGQAEKWTPPSQGPALTPSSYVAAASSSASRTLLTEPLLLPRLKLMSYEAEQIELTATRQAPVLLNFWGSWCQPCLAELSEISKRAEEVRGIGLVVVAANVDGLGDDRGASSDAQQATLERLGYPFLAGPATSQLVGSLEVITNFVYGPDRPLAVPTSFLIDGTGKLAAIYKGRVDVDQLLKDIEFLELQGDERFQAALPFAGRLVGQPLRLRPLGLAAELAEFGFVEVATQFLEDDAEKLSRDSKYSAFAAEITRMLVAEEKFSAALRHLETATKWAPQSAILHAQLGDVLYHQGKMTKAEDALRAALQIAPETVRANFQLGNVLRQRGDLQTAAQYYLRSVESQPEFADAYYQLSAVEFQLGRKAESLAHMQTFVDLRSDDAGARINLGAMLAVDGQLHAAEKPLREALALEPDNANAHINLGRLLQDQGKPGEAESHFRSAMRKSEATLPATVNLVKLLATTDDPSTRNVSEAIALAEQLATSTKASHAEIFDTLALAYAAGEQFEKAILAQSRALKLAQAQGNQRLVQAYSKKLKSLKNRASTPPIR